MRGGRLGSFPAMLFYLRFVFCLLRGAGRCVRSVCRSVRGKAQGAGRVLCVFNVFVLCVLRFAFRFYFFVYFAGRGAGGRRVPLRVPRQSVGE